MKLSKLNDLIKESETIQGHWELSSGHELLYKSRGEEEEIKLRGPLVAAEPGTLVFSYSESRLDKETVTRLLQLSGLWKLDSKNRITFEVEREKGRNDLLVFKGSWKVNEAHEIIYTYERTSPSELIFTGYWDISTQNRLTYYVGGDSHNAFHVRGTFQTKSILAKQGEIRYQAGFELSGTRRIQEIILFGKWKISRDFGLSFEVDYKDGKRKNILFGGEYAWTRDSRISVQLKSRSGEPLGIELILTKDFFDDGQVFLRLAKSIEESRIEAGMKFKW